MKTAVEQLIEKSKDFKFINHEDAFNFAKLLYKAKEIEKNQIIDAFKQGVEYWNGDDWKLIDIEQYYNKTFKSE
jgi:hypothetical protein